MKYLSNKRNNILLTILVSVISTILIFNSGVLDGAGMAVIIVIWIPTIVGLVTIVGYLIMNLITKKYAPIIVLAGNLFNIFLAIRSFFD